MAANQGSTALLERIVQLPRLSIAAELAEKSGAAADGNVSVIWAAEGFLIPVWIPEQGDVWVRLSFEPSAIDSKRLDAGLPVLHEHGVNSRLSNPQIGTTEKWQLEGAAPNRKATAEIRFSDRADPDAQGVIRDVRNRILKGVSFGVWMRSLVFTGEEVDGYPVYVSTSWEPNEISFAVIQKDSRAQQLGTNVDSGPCIVLGFATSNAGNDPAQSRSNRMSLKAGTLAAALVNGDAANNAAAGASGGNAAGEASATVATAPNPGSVVAPAATPPQAPAAVASATLSADQVANAKRQERDRIASIRSLGTRLGIDVETINTLERDENATIDRAREVFTEQLAARVNAQGPATASLRVTSEDGDKVISGAEAALMLRLGFVNERSPDFKEISDRGRSRRGMPVLRLAEDVMTIRGIRPAGYDRDLIARFALGFHGPDDFVNILKNVGNKGAQVGYEAANVSFQRVSQRSEAPDFKPILRVTTGLGSALQKLPTNAEITFGSIADAAETYQIETYAKGIAITRKALVNDDLRMLAKIDQLFGMQSKLLVNRLHWAIIGGNAVLSSDNVALFHTNHANDLGSSPNDLKLGQPGLSAVRKKIRLQKEPDGAIINLVPNLLAVPAALETDGKQAVSSQFTPALMGSINTFQGTELIIEPELDAFSSTAYYMFATMLPALEHAFLNGNDRPMVDAQKDFDVDGVKMRCLFDVGVGLQNYRSVARSAGTT